MLQLLLLNLLALTLAEPTVTQPRAVASDCLTTKFVKDYQDTYWLYIHGSMRIKAIIACTVTLWIGTITLLGVTLGLHYYVADLMVKMRARRIQRTAGNEVLLRPQS